MSPAAAVRAEAARAVDRVLGGSTLDEALRAVPLAGRDRSQVQALAYGAMRWHHRHVLLLGQLMPRLPRSRDRILLALLSVGLYELREGHAPDFAAVSVAVEATRLLGRPRASGFVNAALRRYQRESEQLEGLFCRKPADVHSHPDWVVERLQSDWPAHFHEILKAGQRHPPLWLRVNRHRIGREAWCARLDGVAAELYRPPAFPDAVRLPVAVPLETLPGFSEGQVSVQDAAAQLAAPMLDARAGMRVLDACAAPGGKTAHLLERAGGKLDLVALDRSKPRLERLQENLARLGFAAQVRHADALEPDTWWDRRPFDRILLDAPCSGSGVIRRHPDIKWLRRPDDLPVMAQHQLALLDALWPTLGPGGVVLYATCSVFRAENEQVLQQFAAAHPDAQCAASISGLLQARSEYAEPEAGYLLPGAGDTDGFYYALIRRRP